MSKFISFMHMSLDGFVAGPGGELDWVRINEEIFHHVEQRISQTETALYGRVTYQMMEAYWPTAGDKPNATRHDIEHSKWYKEAGKIVLSRTLSNAGRSNTTIIADGIADKINKIREQPGKEILMFGSPGATHALMEHNLIDGFWLFVNPIILGQGIPLFADIRNKMNLNLEKTHVFNCGVIELCYSIDR